MPLTSPQPDRLYQVPFYFPVFLPFAIRVPSPAQKKQLTKRNQLGPGPERGLSVRNAGVSFTQNPRIPA